MMGEPKYDRRRLRAHAARLRVLLTKLHHMREELGSVGALFMQKLRDSEFLNAIKHRSTIPGGTCEFDLPNYTHWLNLPDEIRGADFALARQERSVARALRQPLRGADRVRDEFMDQRDRIETEIRLVRDRMRIDFELRAARLRKELELKPAFALWKKINQGKPRDR